MEQMPFLQLPPQLLTHMLLMTLECIHRVMARRGHVVIILQAHPLMRSSSFVRGAFVVQFNPIKFEKCGRNVADVQNAAIWLARPKRHKHLATGIT